MIFRDLQDTMVTSPCAGYTEDESTLSIKFPTGRSLCTLC